MTRARTISTGDLSQRLLDMSGRIAELEAALAPFAAFGRLLGPAEPEGFDVLIYQMAGVTGEGSRLVGDDCRRAAAVMEPKL